MSKRRGKDERQLRIKGICYGRQISVLLKMRKFCDENEGARR